MMLLQVAVRLRWIRGGDTGQYDAVLGSHTYRKPVRLGGFRTQRREETDETGTAMKSVRHLLNNFTMSQSKLLRHGFDFADSTICVCKRRM